MIGETISHFRILEKIGEGGMGMVYKAYDTRLNRTVALKFLSHQDATDRDQSSRLLQEARAAAQLTHPNIAAVFDCDTIEDADSHSVRTFIAMEYVEGETLKNLLLRSPLSLDTVRSITIQLGRALSAAHAKGVVHRDLKPANIVLTAGGTVKILDFGIAKLLDETTRSQSKSIVGTVSYMSPEQILGGPVDARTDIWSLGVIIFEMLTQRLPFHAEHIPSLMYSITNGEPASIKDLRPDIPENILTVCALCLQKDPTHRPQSMGEVLHSFGAEEQIDGVPINWAPSRFQLRWMRGAILAVSLIAAILWMTRTWWMPYSQPQKERYRIAVLQFQNLTERPETGLWPSTIQTMIINEFIGVEDLAVIDQLTFNNYIQSSVGAVDVQRNRQLFDLIKKVDAQYLIDGSLSLTNGKYTINYSFVDLSGGGPLTSPRPIVIGSLDSLAAAVRILSNDILNYLQVKVLSSPDEKDLRPWIAHRSQNIQAVQEFMQASQIIFKGMRGAEPHLRRAIELDSSFISPRIWLISGLVQLGRVDEAREQYQTLLRLNGSPFDHALIGWAGAYIHADTAAQMRYLDLALDFSSSNNILLLNLAGLKEGVGDYTGVVETLLPAVNMKWEFSPAYYLLANAYDHLGQRSKAKEILEQSLSFPWVFWDIYRSLAVFALEDKDTIAARKYEAQYLAGAKASLLPDRSYANLASDNFSAGYYAIAVRYYLRALASNPNDAAYHDEIGEAYFLLGDQGPAEKEFLRAVQINPAQLHALFRLGGLVESRGDKAAAARYYIAYLKLDSSSTFANDLRQRVSKLTR